MPKRILSALLGWVLCLGVAFAEGRAYVLSLQGDGSATVLLDEAGGIAYIHDGGRQGSLGIANATIDGQPVLDFLKSHKVTKIVISCSHPHQDHMGGLVTLLSGEAIDDFDVSFVDAIAPGGKGTRLADVYAKHLGREIPKDKVSHGVGRDGFASLRATASSHTVTASNFKYDPKTVGQDVHDASMIVAFDVRSDDGQTTKTLLDFDDASTRLIELWEKTNESRHVDALLMAHHGSRYNDMSAVLDRAEEHGLTDIIFTVNRQNQFLHPTPEALGMALDAVGPDHVHLTGSAPGDAVKVGSVVGAERSEPPPARARLEQFVADRIADAMEKRKTADARRRLRLEEDILGLMNLQDGFDLAPRNRNGTAAFASTMMAMHADDGAAKPPNGDVPDPGLPTNGVGSPGGPLGGSPGSPTRPGISATASDGWSMPTAADGAHYSNFRSAGTARGMIEFGGVLIGNKPTGEAISSLVFLHGPEPGTAVVSATSVHGLVGSFGPVPLAVFWAAYNDVSPTRQLRERLGDVHVEGDAGALVGMVGKHPIGWAFAVNPAIADTTLAEDAMRLDMAVAAAKSDDPLPAEFRSLPWDTVGRFETYQWLDAQARISFDAGHVDAKPDQQDAECLMRLRLLRRPVEPVGDRDPEVARRLKFAMLNRPPSKAPMSREAQARLRADIGQKIGEERAARKRVMALAGSSSLKHYEIEELIQSELSSPSRGLDASILPTAASNRFCRGLGFLRPIETMARLVAIFHRYLDDHPELPPYPSEFIPTFTDSPAEMNFADVWESHSGR